MTDEINHSAEIEGGFILVARAIANSSLMSTPSNAFKVAIWLLARARFEDYKWFDRIQSKDIVIKRGEITCNYNNIVEKTNLSIMQVRTAIDHLLGHGFIQDITPKEVKVAHGYMHFRIKRYDHYQLMDNYFNNTRITQGQHRANTEPTQIQHSDNTYISNDKECISKDISDTPVGAIAPPIPIVKVEKTKRTLYDPNKPYPQYNCNDLLGYFGNEFEQKIGYKYPASFGKDLKIFKDLLALYKPEIIVDTIDIFYEKADEVVDQKPNWTKDKLSVGIYRTRVPELLIALREDVHNG